LSISRSRACCKKSRRHSNGVEHDVAFRRFRDETQSPELESAFDRVLVIYGRENDDRNRRIALAQLAEDGEPISIRQIDIKQNEVEVRMFLDRAHGLTAVRSFQYDGVALQLFQDSMQCLANQCVIVDKKKLHTKISGIHHCM
jgi:hypothetical protein